jgi:hypothetical protein
VITNVSLSGLHGQQNGVIVSGCSPTIKLDGKDTMDSFMDKSLKQIVDEAVGNSGNGGSVTSNPKFGGTLDYVCQYNESCFELINRLSWLYGEWFFYDGQKIYFGKPGNDEEHEIKYDIHMTSFKLDANLVPPKFNRYHYLHHDPKDAKFDAQDIVPGVEGYLQKSLSMSNELYTSEAKLPLNPVVKVQKELEDMLKVEKTRAVGEMLIMSGTTQTCAVKIGKKVKISFPEGMEIGKKDVDTFRVIEVTHVIDQEGRYSNSFKGIMANLENIPMIPCPAPMTGPQLAWVKSNDDKDKKGRVQVQFQWQKKDKTTNWIRVQTPDAGPGHKDADNPYVKYDKIVPENRGFVSIPEEGDVVMVGFEYGDPNRPYVMGSIFCENKSKGGDVDNKRKSFTTRVDSSIVFDDEKGSVVIKDQQGSDSTMTFDGEKNIVIKADETITLVCGKSIIVMEKDGTITVNGSKIYVAASDEMYLSTGDLEGGNYSGISIEPNDIGISAMNDLTEVAKNVTIGAGGSNVVALDGGGEITINGTKVNIN